MLTYEIPKVIFWRPSSRCGNKDVLYVSNATSVEIAKVLQYFRLTVATVNDPIVAAQNAFLLRNIINADPAR
jgi:polysaccharide biosynthesis/export protein